MEGAHAYLVSLLVVLHVIHMLVVSNLDVAQLLLLLYLDAVHQDFFLAHGVRV